MGLHIVSDNAYIFNPNKPKYKTKYFRIGKKRVSYLGFGDILLASKVAWLSGLMRPGHSSCCLEVKILDREVVSNTLFRRTFKGSEYVFLIDSCSFTFSSHKINWHTQKKKEKIGLCKTTWLSWVINEWRNRFGSVVYVFVLIFPQPT